MIRRERSYGPLSLTLLSQPSGKIALYQKRQYVLWFRFPVLEWLFDPNAIDLLLSPYLCSDFTNDRIGHVDPRKKEFPESTSTPIERVQVLLLFGYLTLCPYSHRVFSFPEIHPIGLFQIVSPFPIIMAIIPRPGFIP